MGFPGETDADFEALLDFVREAQFRVRGFPAFRLCDAAGCGEVAEYDCSGTVCKRRPQPRTVLLAVPSRPSRPRGRESIAGVAKRN